MGEFIMEHSENTRVKIPGLVHLTRLGYNYLSLKEEKEYIHTNTNIFRKQVADCQVVEIQGYHHGEVAIGNSKEHLNMLNSFISQRD